MDNLRISRRALMLAGLGMAVGGCIPTGRPTLTTGFDPKTFDPARDLDPRFRRQQVDFSGPDQAGTIVVNTSERFLYAVEPGGTAMRYGVGVGEEGLSFKGTAKIGRKADWPSWTPTASMIERKPRLAQYAGGVPGGPNNPLGARAMYLYQGGQDTMFRVHGTNEPWTIGTAVSNGCIRLTNDDIIDLYDRTPVGTVVRVI
ncbi:MAG: oxidoreductase [Mesorhizobium sp. SCN 65-20]|nr:MAG: oxidoreductase [Mesorhizobium sp. SCN 65-20]